VPELCIITFRADKKVFILTDENSKIVAFSHEKELKSFFDSPRYYCDEDGVLKSNGLVKDRFVNVVPVIQRIENLKQLQEDGILKEKCNNCTVTLSFGIVKCILCNGDNAKHWYESGKKIKVK